MIWPWDMANWAGALLAGLSVSAAEAPHAEPKTAPAPVPARIAAARPAGPPARPPTSATRTGGKAKVAAKPARAPAPARVAVPPGKSAAKPPAKSAAKPPARSAAKPPAQSAAKPPALRAKPAEPARVIVLDEVKRKPTVLGWRGEGGAGAHYETGTPLAFKLGAGAKGDGGVTGHRPVWRAAPGYSESSYLLTGRAIWRY
jgi:hypothetical protein